MTGFRTGRSGGQATRRVVSEAQGRAGVMRLLSAAPLPSGGAPVPVQFPGPAENQAAVVLKQQRFLPEARSGSPRTVRLTRKRFVPWQRNGHEQKRRGVSGRRESS